MRHTVFIVKKISQPLIYLILPLYQFVLHLDDVSQRRRYYVSRLLNDNFTNLKRKRFFVSFEMCKLKIIA